MNERPPQPGGRTILQATMAAGIVLVAVAAYLAAGVHRDPRFLVFLGVLEACVVLAWIGNTIRPHPALPVAMAGAGLAGLAASNGPIAGFGVLMALTSARRRVPLLHAAPCAAVVVIVAEVIGSGWRSPPLWIAFQAAGFAAALLAAACVRQVMEERARARAALAELEDLRELQVRAARVAERVRMAREMHHVLGDTLSSLTVQIESARLELVRQPGGQAAFTAVAALDRAHRLAREGVDEARRALGTLRGDPLPGPALLAGLVTEFERDTGSEARLRVEGRPVELAPEARLAVYRTAQEALGDVREQAHGGRVKVRLRYQSDGAELTVESDGGQASAWSDGRGLAAIRERAELLGGRLETARTDEGIRVRLWLPALEADLDSSG